MRFIDITRPLQEAPVYPGDEPPSVTAVHTFEDGGAYRDSRIISGSHAGTHADACTHFLPESAASIDQMPLESYYGPCVVHTVFPCEGRIEAHELEGVLPGCERLILRTNGTRALSRAAAFAAAKAGVKLVATDALSIAPPEDEAAVHRLLLGFDVAILENLTLEHAPDGAYTLCAFPNRIAGCDGAPVRAVLIAQDAE